MDLFDYKPKMDAMYDKDLPEESIRKASAPDHHDQRPGSLPHRSFWKYRFACGEATASRGMWISERLLPWTARLADEIALVKTVWTEERSTTTRR